MPDRSRRIHAAGAGLLAVLLLAACRESGGEGEYFEISGKLFEFNYRLGIATYVVTLNPLQPVADGQTAVVSFQDPAGGDPIEVKQRIWPKLGHVTLTSPPLTCVTTGIPYAVAIRIVDEDGRVLQEIDTTMTSSLDQSILPDRPLVIGPVYELNPDLEGHPDGKRDDQAATVCPPKA
ncbi:MAG: hypothetical protein KF723_16710 [Rhizobiaceae bacterium]|nr:hypothetical protein [Rhizobiaceae bacterium]